MGRLLTQAVVILTLAILGAYDAYIISEEGYDASISVVVLYWSHKAPIIPFIVGVIAGHLFWPQASQEST
jgi:hypothetical protein